MAKQPPPASDHARQERLAAKLRENLTRRKQQARAQQAPTQQSGNDPALPKPPPES